MKTLIRNLLSASSVLIFMFLPAMANGESQADKSSNTPVETWNSFEAELERAVLTESLEPTAAGHSDYDEMVDSQQDAVKHGSGDGMGHMTTDHGMKQYKSAHDYKRSVFGND